MALPVVPISPVMVVAPVLVIAVLERTPKVAAVPRFILICQELNNRPGVLKLPLSTGPHVLTELRRV